MTTDLAQRRLLEAIADLGATHGGVQQLMVGMEPAIELAEEAGSSEMAAVFRAISDLAAAVSDDLKGATDG